MNVRKIYPNKKNVEKPVAVAHVYGKNVIEIKRGKDVIKIIGSDFQVLATDPIEGESVVTAFSVENGELVTSDIVVKEFDADGNEVGKKEEEK